MKKTSALRQVIRIVALLNLAYFAVEFTVATTIGSVSLFADSIDFLEDASINLLIFMALRWSAHRRALVGKCLAFILFVPALATLWMVWKKFTMPVAPSPVLLSLVGSGAFIVNFSCALMLARYRHHDSSLMRAAFLSARNDVLANIAIVFAGLVTAYLWPTAWPDIIVGLGIAAMTADAAHEIWTAATKERLAAKP
ncbi:MAG: cation transporter [Alphaproteobacteria bacterium]|nr:cation transporter [Alphaproteobacteria bacterium]